MTDATDYPVCEGCGEKHPQMTLGEAYSSALALIVIKAVDVAEANPGLFPELEAALDLGDKIANQIKAALTAPPAAPKPPPNDSDRGYGQYL